MFLMILYINNVYLNREAHILKKCLAFWAGSLYFTTKFSIKGRRLIDVDK